MWPAGRSRTRPAGHFSNPQKMPALNDASGPIRRSHGAALMAREKPRQTKSILRRRLFTGGQCPYAQRQAGTEAVLKRGAARTRRCRGIGPWRPEAEGRDRSEGRRPDGDGAPKLFAFSKNWSTPKPFVLMTRRARLCTRIPAPKSYGNITRILHCQYCARQLGRAELAKGGEPIKLCRLKALVRPRMTNVCHCRPRQCSCPLTSLLTPSPHHHVKYYFDSQR